jgi:hypothetical protein
MATPKKAAPKPSRAGKGNKSPAARRPPGKKEVDQEEYVYVYWRDSSRQTFAIGNIDITFVPSANGEGDPIKNKLKAKYWRALEDGKGKSYIKHGWLVKTHAPIDKIDEAQVHVVAVRRGITESRASENARRKLEASSSTTALEARLDRIIAQQEADREVNTLQARLIEKLEGQLGTAERERVDAATQAKRLKARLAELEGGASAQPVAAPFDPGALQANDIAAKLASAKLTKPQLEALIVAEVRNKNRKTVLEAIAKALGN